MKNIFQLNIAAYEEIKSNIRGGSTELDVYREVSNAFNKTAGQKIDFLCDIISGERSERVEGEPTNRVLKNGDTLIVDILPRYKGIYSDTTRTFFIGKPSEKQRAVYEVLCSAIRFGEGLLKAGVSANDIYCGVKKIIDDSGYGAYFPHHAGHRVGEESLMEPDFVSGNTQTICEGMAVTLESGIYISNEFGIRVENNYLIEKNGCKALFDYPLNIEYFILEGL